MRKTYDLRSPRSDHSNRSQRGLYHGVGHSHGYRISFSHKKAHRTYKPNVHRKKLYSETLDTKIRMWVTTRALKNINKKGGLDEYLLNTKPKQIDSKFGMILRDIIQTKQENPHQPVPYIPKQKRQDKENIRAYKSWFGKRPAIYQAPQFRVRPEYMQTERTPADMRPEERKKLFEELLANQEPEDDIPAPYRYDDRPVFTAEGQRYEDAVDLENLKFPDMPPNRVDESKLTEAQKQELEWWRPKLEQFQPIRHKFIKNELMRFRNKREKMLLVMRHLAESEDLIEKMLGDKYVSIFERYPDLAEAYAKIAQRDRVAHRRIMRGEMKKQPIEGPEGAHEERKLIEAQNEGIGTELTTRIDYNPKTVGLKKDQKRERIRDIKKKFDHL